MSATSFDPKLLSIVVSVYNEEESLQKFWEVLRAELEKLDIATEVLFVNDGSMDRSREMLDAIAGQNAGVQAIHFSRNYGHEAAMIAGIDHAKGDAIICLDADLQHPPTKIVNMLNAHRNGHHIVNMVRTTRQDNGFFKNMLSKIFYWFINKISPVKFEPSASDFFLISKKVANILRKDFRERTRFIRGYIQIVGFSKTRLEFEAVAREEGESKYSLYRLIVLSTEAIVAFSRMPLHLGLLGGVICAFIGIGVGVYSILVFLLDLDNQLPPGYTTLIVLMSFLFSFLFFIVGIMGVYLGHIYEENRKRPIYIVDEVNQQAAPRHED